MHIIVARGVKNDQSGQALKTPDDDMIRAWYEVGAHHSQYVVTQRKKSREISSGEK